MAKGKASGGGVKSARDVHAYRPPQGPTSINNPQKPGLHGDKYRHGTQGPVPCKSYPGGHVGLGGENKGRGVNRRG
jgi:hypothetical protein